MSLIFKFEFKKPKGQFVLMETQNNGPVLIKTTLQVH